MSFNSILKIRRLFRECVEALGVILLPAQQEQEISDLFEKTYPITEWGKIDWDKINLKINIGFDPELIIPSLEKLLGKKYDQSVYILWSDGGIPVIKTNLSDVVACFDDVVCVSFETFIFNLEMGYIIEVPTSGDMNAGVVQRDPANASE